MIIAHVEDAVDAMRKRGLEHQEMDMAGDYKAFSLPDGRVLILSVVRTSMRWS